MKHILPGGYEDVQKKSEAALSDVDNLLLLFSRGLRRSYAHLLQNMKPAKPQVDIVTNSKEEAQVEVLFSMPGRNLTRTRAAAHRRRQLR